MIKVDNENREKVLQKVGEVQIDGRTSVEEMKAVIHYFDYQLNHGEAGAKGTKSAQGHNYYAVQDIVNDFIRRVYHDFESTAKK